MLRVFLHQIEERALLPSLRRQDFHPVPRPVRKCCLQQFAVLEIHRYVHRLRQVFRFQIKLLQKRRHEFLGLELVQIFPIKLPAVHHAPSAQVKQICRNLRRFGVKGQHVRVVALRARNFLPLFDVFKGAQKVAVRRGLLEPLFARRRRHAPFEAFHQVVTPSFEKHPRVPCRLGVARIRRESGHARPEAPLDVILQAGPRMVARQIHGAGRYLEPLVDEMQNPARQSPRKVRSKVERAVLLDPPREIHARVFLPCCELDVGIRLVVAQ